MNLKLISLPLAIASVMGGTAYGKPQKKVDNPNIVFILADDLGYGDVSSFNENSKIQTPNIDLIASQGVRFTDAHTSSSVCTPTRYGILTGRYNWRSSLKSGVLNGFNEALIVPERETIASILKKNGYKTGCIGKWHLGWTWANVDQGIEKIDYLKPITHGPTTLGFDYFYGFSGSLDMPPYVWVKNDLPTKVPTENTYRPKGQDFWRKGPTSDDFDHEKVLLEITEKAKEFIHEHATQKNPFFLYLPLSAPHTPNITNRTF